MIDGILFDKDGTLFDFRKSWGNWAEDVLGTLARDPTHLALLADAIGYIPTERDFRSDSVVIGDTMDEVAARLLPNLPGCDAADLTAWVNAAAAAATMVAAVPLIPLFNTLKGRGLKIGLATNDIEGAARAHLTAHGVTEMMDFIAGCDSGHGAKPGPGMCLAFAHAVGLDPTRLAMVGDSPHDLEAGRAAGMWRVAVLTGIARIEELSPHADVVLPDIAALPMWLTQQA